MTAATARSRRGVLRHPRQFEAVLQAGLRVVSRNFVARALANDASEARLGMIAGKKAASRAVDRNRAKRLIRETFRAAAPQIGAYDVTVQLRSNLRADENSAVRAELRTLFESLVRRCARANTLSGASSVPSISSDRP